MSLVAVEISPGRQRPYYIKSEGLENGVYIRRAAMSRPAQTYQIQEMLSENGAKIFGIDMISGITSTINGVNNKYMKIDDSQEYYGVVHESCGYRKDSEYSEREQKLLDIFQYTLKATQKELGKLLDISLRSVKRLIADLQSRNIIRREGSGRTGRWVIL